MRLVISIPQEEVPERTLPCWVVRARPDAISVAEYMAVAYIVPVFGSVHLMTEYDWLTKRKNSSDPPPSQYTMGINGSGVQPQVFDSGGESNWRGGGKGRRSKLAANGGIRSLASS